MSERINCDLCGKHCERPHAPGANNLRAEFASSGTSVSRLQSPSIDVCRSEILAALAMRAEQARDEVAILVAQYYPVQQ